MRNPLWLAVLLCPVVASAAWLEGAERPEMEIPSLGVSLPTLAVSPALSAASPIVGLAAAPNVAAPQAVTAQAQVQSLGAQLSAAKQGEGSQKETLDAAFERSVAQAKGDTVPSVAPADKPAAPSLSPSKGNGPSAPQPPAPKDPRSFWQKHGYTVKGATLGTIILAASTYILGAKSLEIPAFIGFLTGLLPYLRSTHADGKAGDYLPVYVQSILGGGLGLVLGYALSHWGLSLAMAGTGVLTGLLAPYLTASLRKPNSDPMPLGHMVLSGLAGAFVGATLPAWIGGKIGERLDKRKASAK